MKHLYRFTATILMAALSLTAIFSSPVHATEEEVEARYNKEIQSNSWESWPAGPPVYAESAIVMEAGTGAILYAKSMDEQHYPASITKIMTALLALENLDLDEEVTFSHEAAFSIEPGSSSICRNEGEILTVEECLYALMLESANECGNALAEQVSGNIEAFAELMNQKAADLGCTGTHFVNPHGLPDENHYTTAHDMALITQEAIKHEEFRRISGTSGYTLRATNKNDEELVMHNHHSMIYPYRTPKFVDDTVFAGKTGYTNSAMNTLVTCATRNNMDLICVTLKTQSTGERGVPLYTDTVNLLNYAGENFHKINISQNETNFTISQNELFDTGSFIFGESNPIIEMDTDGYIVLPTNVEFSQASPKLEFTDEEDSPIIATLKYYYADQEVGSTDLFINNQNIQEFNFQKTDSSEETIQNIEQPGDIKAEENTEPNLIKINLRVVGIAIAGLILLLTIILFIRKLYKDYHMDWNIIRRRKRRKEEWYIFSNQKRYQNKNRRDPFKK